MEMLRDLAECGFEVLFNFVVNLIKIVYQFSKESIPWRHLQEVIMDLVFETAYMPTIESKILM